MIIEYGKSIVAHWDEQFMTSDNMEGVGGGLHLAHTTSLSKVFWMVQSLYISLLNMGLEDRYAVIKD